VLVIGALGLAACDGLLDVEIPGQIVEEALYDPSQATVLVNSAISHIECALPEFAAGWGAAYEDVVFRITGFWPGVLEYNPVNSTTACQSTENSSGFWSWTQAGRYIAEQGYESISGWTDEQVANRQQLLAQSAIYAGLAYNLFGEYYCEVAVDMGELMGPDATLAKSEEWLTKALGHIEQSGDFAIANGITSSAEQMALVLRARVRFNRGDLPGAREDALRVTKGFVAVATRDAGGDRTRWNRMYNAYNATFRGTVSPPVDWWTGAGWPDVIPFTGYRNLGILPDGRAISDARNPITTTGAASAVADVRVPVVQLFLPNGEPRIFNGWPVWVQMKYPAVDSDFPIANWEEAWLILAEVEGGQGAIDRVNEIRAYHDLPLVTYANPADAAQIENMIIEETRRSLFLEGRFWSTKLRKDLWFPRGVGTTPFGYQYNVGVRLVMPTDEFHENPNIGGNEDLRGTMCRAEERPVLG
jgi:hypothetical protein